MKEYLKELQPYLEKGMAFQSALTLYQWDLETLAPKLAEDNTSKVIGILSNEYYHAYMNPEVKRIVKKLDDKKYLDKMTEKEKGIVEELKKLEKQIGNIPVKEYREFSEFSATASSVWAKAKEKQDYAMFAPTLEKMIETKKKFIRYRGGKEKEIYNAMLNDYEPGFEEEQIDSFFEQMKKEIVPLVKKIAEKKSVLYKKYSKEEKKMLGDMSYGIEKQKEFCKYLSEYIGFDHNKGVIAESAHPFTTALHNHDVRITNHYNEKNLVSAIFSAIHETGHALYELNIKDEYTQTLLGEGTSMGMHESQSRFWENMIGRNASFWKPLFPKLQDVFPEPFKNLTLEEFMTEINQVEPQPIRTEADELTYPLHIIIRYEMEKEMFHKDKISMEELEQMWNEKYESYLGYTPKNASEGILQDIHWANGEFGYFPSYAVGSAVAAQIYAHIKDVMPVEEYLEKGNLLPIREYLKEHIHQYGKVKNTNEILKDMMQEEFNPRYYIEYLREKYSEMYLIH